MFITVLRQTLVTGNMATSALKEAHTLKYIFTNHHEKMLISIGISYNIYFNISLMQRISSNMPVIIRISDKLLAI